MIAVHLNTILGDDRKLTIQLPDNVPPGEVEVVVRAFDPITITETPSVNTARERAKRKLSASGALVTQFDVPTDARRLTVEERMRIGTLPKDARSSLDFINDDRGEW